MDVSDSHYDKVGNKSGIVCWGFDHDRKMWWIKRKIGIVEYYSKPGQFQSLTKVDLSMLANAPYTDDKREVERGFPSMKTEESILKPAPRVRDPRTHRQMKIVVWPPTDKEKTIPLVKKIPEGGLKNLHFWDYDEFVGQVLMVCDDDVQFRMTDQVDLLTVSLQDLEVLAQNQIRSTEKYKSITKEWSATVAGALQARKQGFTGLRNTSRSDGSS
ncbi:hypothetical protein HanHA300_Chr05g0168171 [Helianthus annuus]|nr:hypothetical protein HanHA300_Chr05g0168171 [Helianthus annuus]